MCEKTGDASIGGDDRTRSSFSTGECDEGSILLANSTLGSIDAGDQISTRADDRNGEPSQSLPPTNENDIPNYVSTIPSSSRRMRRMDDSGGTGGSWSLSSRVQAMYGSIVRATSGDGSADIFNGRPPACPHGTEDFIDEVDQQGQIHPTQQQQQPTWRLTTQPLAPPQTSTTSASLTPLHGSSRIYRNRVTSDLTRLSQRPVRKIGETFLEDAINMTEGTIPQSIVLAIAIGAVCGVASYLYYLLLFTLLDVIWRILPEMFVIGRWSEEYYVLWIPIVGFVMAVGVGLSVVLLGEPGDLAYTIKCVHESAYLPTDHVLPMLVASLFSILGGVSLGPEAPLVAICAALGGFVSRRIFRQRNRNVVRKHTLMGMAGALSAFFGCPLGGSLFALEVNSRFGVEYFEHLVESIFCGEVCLVVFRAFSGLKIGPIWKISDSVMGETEPLIVLVGGAIGLLGAGVAAIFATLHWRVMDTFEAMGLLDNKYAVQRAILGACGTVGIGVLVPHTMFWGEDSFPLIARMAPARELTPLWPPTGAIGFEIDSYLTALTVGFAKIVAISLTVAGGFRGGFIFPFFATGAALGRALVLICPSIPVQVACLCFAAAINVAITRTALATTLILTFLAGEQNAISAVLAASLVSLFATGYMPFIKTQIVRSDIDHSLFFRKRWEPAIDDSTRRSLDFDFDGSSGDISQI